MKNIHLEELYDKLHNVLSQHFTGMLLENCVLCLKEEGHNDGVTLHPYSHSKNLVSSIIEFSKPQALYIQKCEMYQIL